MARAAVTIKVRSRMTEALSWELHVDESKPATALQMGGISHNVRAQVSIIGQGWLSSHRTDLPMFFPVTVVAVQRKAPKYRKPPPSGDLSNLGKCQVQGTWLLQVQD